MTEFSFKKIVDKQYDARIVATAPIPEVDAYVFCTSSKYLGENLFPWQSLVIKLYYGLWEKYPITPEEQKIIDILKDEWHINLDLSKRDPKQITEILILVLGRRSGKSSLISFIQTYEAYKLICKGDPQRYYKIRSRHPIWSINCAKDGEQAKDPFRLCKDNIRRIPFFQKYIDWSKDTGEELRMYTPADLYENDQIKKYNATRKQATQKKNLLEGSIMIASFTTTAASKRGKAIIALILDEFAHFDRAKSTTGGMSDEEITKETAQTDYAMLKALQPSTKDFNIPDEGIFDGKVIMISSPREKGGEFYKHYCLAGGWEQANPQREDINPQYLMLQLSTWQCNPKYTRESLDTDFKKDPVGCFIKGTPILMSNGTYKNIEDIEKGDYVITHIGRARKVLKTFVHEVSENIYKINVKGLVAPFYVTKNHPFEIVSNILRFNDKYAIKGKTIFSYNIRENDLVVTPKINISETTPTVSKNFARLLGYYLAEGSIKYDARDKVANAVVFSFNALGPDDEYIKEVENLFKTEFNLIASKYINKMGSCVDVTFHSRKIALLFKEWGGERSKTKELRKEVLSWPSEYQLELVGSYFNGDGHQQKHPKNKSSQACVTTISKNLAYQIHFILMKNNIANTVYTYHYAYDKNRRYQVIVRSAFQNMLTKYCKIIDNPFNSRDVSLIKLEDFGIVRPITHIEDIFYTGFVYNIEVEEDNSYIANDVSVHNSSMEYGSHFGEPSTTFIDSSKIDEMIDDNRRVTYTGMWGYNYIISVDPATKGDTYAVCWGHTEYVSGQGCIYVVDGLQGFRSQFITNPTTNRLIKLPVQPFKVVEFIKMLADNLSAQGNVLEITFDQWSCLPESTQLYTEKGLKTIKELVASNIPIKVATKDGTFLATKFYNNGCREVKKITTKFGYTLTGTDNHPIWTPKGWVNIQALNPGDIIGIKSGNLFSNTDTISEKQAIIYGYLTSEGTCVGNRRGHFGFSNTEEELHREYQQLVKEVFNIPVYEILGNKIYLTSLTKRGTKVKFDSSESSSYRVEKILMEDEVTGVCETKRVPKPVREGSKKIICSYLSALYEGDGNIGTYTNKRLNYNLNDTYIEYNTISETLADDLHLLLLNLGIVASKQKISKKFQNCFGKIRKVHDVYRLMIRGENVDKFASIISFRSEHKKEELKEAVRRRSNMDNFRCKKYFDIDEICWLPIQKIEDTGVEQVYDITVPETHSFIANGIITHNSSDSIATLRKSGYAAVETFFSNPYKNDIYTNFLEKLNMGAVKIASKPPVNPPPGMPPYQFGWLEQSKLELKYLTKITSGNTVYYAAPSSGPVQTDDWPDVIANMVHRHILYQSGDRQIVQQLAKQIGHPIKRSSGSKPVVMKNIFRPGQGRANKIGDIKNRIAR